MKKSRHTEAQISGILKEGTSGIAVPDICRKHGISSATYYKWRSQYGGLEVPSLRVSSSSKKKTVASKSSTSTRSSTP